MISARKLDNGISIVMEEMQHLNSVSKPAPRYSAEAETHH